MLCSIENPAHIFNANINIVYLKENYTQLFIVFVCRVDIEFSRCKHSIETWIEYSNYVRMCGEGWLASIYNVQGLFY